MVVAGSYVDSIRTSLRAVVSQLLATSVEYRTMTSVYGVDTRAYGSWTTSAAVVTGPTHMQSFDEIRGEQVRHEVLSVRLSDAIDLRQGDQVRLASDDAQIWAIDGRESGGPGSYRYSCVRDHETLVSGGNRGGGV